MDKKNIAIKLIIFILFFTASGVFGYRYLSARQKDEISTDYDYEMVQIIQEDKILKQAITDYSAGRTDKSPVKKRLNELKKEKVIRTYRWSLDGNSITCVLPGGTGHLIVFGYTPKQ